MTEPLSHLPPGRRAYTQARRLLRRKRTTCVPPQMGIVLQFPKKKEAPDGEDQDD